MRILSGPRLLMHVVVPLCLSFLCLIDLCLLFHAIALLVSLSPPCAQYGGGGCKAAKIIKPPYLERPQCMHTFE